MVTRDSCGARAKVGNTWHLTLLGSDLVGLRWTGEADATGGGTGEKETIFRLSFADNKGKESNTKKERVDKRDKRMNE